ncbi:gp609 [Bacillus phage G]|uniref:Gp609 n=1 Tax=Bacillus phage G TaxID=2884420 RepID=G3MAY9_9CAUD|nr:gp609 [Bacillus phage G]AEO93854.1 gp609 [Bacillus phage G]
MTLTKREERKVWIEKAKKCYINCKGLSIEEIKQKISEYVSFEDVAREAHKLGIDYTGLRKQEIIDRINEKKSAQ